MTACVNLVAANETPTLQPGFRLKRKPDGAELWLPSLTAGEAEHSVQAVLQPIGRQALPYFENVRTLLGLSTLLASERWASGHHLSFQRGVADALNGDSDAALQHLNEAIQLYRADGRDWSLTGMRRAEALRDAILAGTSKELLTVWYQANSRAHGIQSA